MMSDQPPTRADFVRRGDDWEATVRVRGSGPTYLAVEAEVLTDAAVAAVQRTWGERARRLREARDLVGRETLIAYYQQELGYGRNRLERMTFSAAGALRTVVFAFTRSYAVVVVTFQDDVPIRWDSVG